MGGDAESPAASAASANGVFGDCKESIVEVSGGRNHKGLTMGMGAMFLVGEMAGAGVLNLPSAILNTGWAGVPMMVVLCGAVGYTGTRLALCWVIVEERWEEYRAPCRRPYPVIARQALGRPGQIVTEVALFVTLFGAGTVYLLLVSQQTHDLLYQLVPSLSQCAWTLIIGLILTPFTWLGTPKEFWPASVLAVTSTFLACLVVLSEVIIEKDLHPFPEYPNPSFNSFFLGFGSILFSLGGACIFPTIQNDMKDRSQFPHSVVITFLVLLGLYLPVSIISYGILGSQGIKENIMQSVSGKAVIMAQVFLLCHFLFAFVIVVNPVYQTIEGILNLPNELGIRRCLLRTGLMMAIVVTGLAVPEFSKILDLMGGSTITLLSFILPALCYMRLCALPGPDGLPHRKLRRWEMVLLYAIVAVGLAGGVASTWSALVGILSPKSFSTTCFSSSAFLS
ncbi:Amino acid transporter AVT1A-like [Homarus americanus]|uniref:Amino acid transporter AVT1A-like n=1 Tax=Homarus americanus TaxID=6706 RepID=A0A8J5NAB5_HOMAM|nr:Amino acid transporter AVT1A-like [Homarus americanus]